MSDVSFNTACKELTIAQIALLVILPIPFPALSFKRKFKAEFKLRNLQPFLSIRNIGVPYVGNEDNIVNYISFHKWSCQSILVHLPSSLKPQIHKSRSSPDASSLRSFSTGSPTFKLPVTLIFSILEEKKKPLLITIFFK